MTISKFTLAGLGALVGAAFLTLPMLPANAAANSVTTQCSAKYKAAKKAGTLNGQKWPQFLSACSASLKEDKGASSAAASKKETKKTRKAASRKKAPSCTAQYKAAKAGGVLDGKTRKQFMADCKAGNTQEAMMPPEPKSTKASSRYKAPTVDKNGKPLTPGQIAFRKRIHECGAEWQQAKAAGKLKSGQKWPQFWSACNKRLKAHQG